MDFFVIASADWMWLVYVAMVVIGLGMMIFVHELGHFLVAKACGVRCDKFYLGFDFFGLKLFSFRWGETEYGIGIVPLGGYVKMLGQEDNPSRLREELEKAKAAKAAEGEGKEVADLERALFDPRSYLAKSVPQRMAIISAGVIMNIIFAFVISVIAYFGGVEQVRCGVGAVAPGEAAWRAGLSVGDTITAIDGKPVYRFSDLQHGVSLSDPDAALTFTVRSPDNQERQVEVKPDRFRIGPTVGVAGPITPVLGETLPFLPGNVAESVTPKLLPGDRITAIDEIPVANARDLHRALALRWGVPVRLTIERQGPSGEKTFEVELPPQPVRCLGLVMTPGPVAAVKPGSIAEKHALTPGETIVAVSVEGHEPWDGDPMRLPYYLQQAARAVEHATAEVTLEKDGTQRTIELPLELAESFAQLYAAESRLEIPQWGVTIEVLPRVQAVREIAKQTQIDEKTSPLLEPGDEIISARVIPPDPQIIEEKYPDAGFQQPERTLVFDDPESRDFATWPAMIAVIQETLPETTVELVVRRDGKLFDTRLHPVPDPTWHFPDRGLYFADDTYTVRAGLGEAIVLGGKETLDAITVVYRMLERLGSGDVSPRAMTGPIGLVGYAYRMASQGFGRYLLFLAFLSANLAVLNFLPIPVLDGGHMVFLLYEAIFRKPPDERVFVGLSYVGLFLLLALMLWVFGLDLNLIPR
ncbi:site-2 protease family protein [Thermostilla marina]